MTRPPSGLQEMGTGGASKASLGGRPSNIAQFQLPCRQACHAVCATYRLVEIAVVHLKMLHVLDGGRAGQALP